MKLLSATVAAFGLISASPAFADIVNLPASANQGILVHNPGPETIGAEVIANLGAGGPNIVHFNGDTTGAGDEFRLQNGQGQADITAAEQTPGGNPNDTFDILNGNIFLTGNEGMTWIELGLTGTDNGTVDFVLTDNLGNDWNFMDLVLGEGDTHFGFQAVNGQFITNLFYSIDDPPGGITTIKQVRILRAGDTTVVPEPGTWAMMLLGFGAAGYALRSRRRRRTDELTQVA